MKKTLALLSAAVLAATLTFGAYPNVSFVNQTKKTAQVTVNYISAVQGSCKSDVFTVKAGAKDTVKVNRGSCLIKSITVPGAKAFTSTTGTAYSTFGLVQNADSSLVVYRFEKNKPVK